MKYRFLLFALITVLLGCQTTELFNQKLTTEQQQCVRMCVKKMQQCQTVCRNNCKNCQHIQAMETKREWCLYRHAQQVTGDVLFRQLNSYKDPLQCQKATCDCQADKMVCEQSCRGFIRKSLTVQRQCRSC